MASGRARAAYSTVAKLARGIHREARLALTAATGGSADVHRRGYE